MIANLIFFRCYLIWVGSCSTSKKMSIRHRAHTNLVRMSDIWEVCCTPMVVHVTNPIEVSTQKSFGTRCKEYYGLKDKLVVITNQCIPSHL